MDCQSFKQGCCGCCVNMRWQPERIAAFLDANTRAAERLFRAPEADKPTVLLMIDRNELEDQMLKNLAALGLGNLVFLDAVSKPVRRYVGPLPEWWGLCVGLGHILVLSALPILGAGLLARRQRVEAARQTLAYSYSAVVLFAVVCGGPIEIGATLPLVLMGLGGLGGAFLVTLVEENCAL